MLSRKLRVITLVIVALSILIFSLIPNNPITIKRVQNIDKLEHYIAYLILAFLLYLNIYENNTSRIMSVMLTLTLAVIYGSIIELLQRYTGRSPELLDIMADFIGSLSGTTVGLFLFKRVA